MVRAELLVELGETGVPGFVDVGFVVAIGVFHVGDFAGHRDEDAALPGLHAGDERKVIGENGGGFVVAVAVLIAEDGDARALGGIFGGTGWVIAHLGDPEAAFFIEPDSDRTNDVGLVRDELDFETGIDFDLLERFLGRGGGRGGGAIG